MPLTISSQLHALAQRSQVQLVNWSCAQAVNCRVWIKRDDLLHPAVSGNKLFKLFHHLKQALAALIQIIFTLWLAWLKH
jgi:1-aminocyclopropane-1-carboxylate deaminase/D-cysteine desulfhydrase-like pyridoxal-dependent ACC family enzyme